MKLTESRVSPHDETLYNYVASRTDVFGSLSDNESSNKSYLNNAKSEHRRRRFEKKYEQPSTNPDYGAKVGSKRLSKEAKHRSRRNKIKVDVGDLAYLVKESKEIIQMTKYCIERNDPYPMLDCLLKLADIEKITSHAKIAVVDALKISKDNKATLMNWDGEILKHWIKYVVSCHPKFCNSAVWVD